MNWKLFLWKTDRRAVGSITSNKQLDFKSRLSGKIFTRKLFKLPVNFNWKIPRRSQLNMSVSAVKKNTNNTHQLFRDFFLMEMERKRIPKICFFCEHLDLRNGHKKPIFFCWHSVVALTALAFVTGRNSILCDVKRIK